MFGLQFTNHQHFIGIQIISSSSIPSPRRLHRSESTQSRRGWNAPVGLVLLEPGDKGPSHCKPVIKDPANVQHLAYTEGRGRYYFKLIFPIQRKHTLLLYKGRRHVILKPGCPRHDLDVLERIFIFLKYSVDTSQ